MAAQFYVTIQGVKQGKFHGEMSGEKMLKGSENKIGGLAFKYEVIQPADPATGLATGKAQHEPVTIVKEWGAASPQIFTALVTNENLSSVLFEFVETTPQGVEAIYHTIKLTNARVTKVSLSADAPTPGVLGDTRELEEITFVFQDIELNNIDAGTTAEAGFAGPEASLEYKYSRVGVGGAAAQGAGERIGLLTPIQTQGAP